MVGAVDAALSYGCECGVGSWVCGLACVAEFVHCRAYEMVLD